MSGNPSETRKRKTRLKRKSIDIAHYRLHPQAIEQRAWRDQVTVTRAGKAWFCPPTPWLMPPSFRNRKYLTDEQRRNAKSLRPIKVRLHRPLRVIPRLWFRQLNLLNPDLREWWKPDK